eukprot:TRINITY_DN3165_c0_g1_i4.p1 TRINITY_DN3165_c0_g1~~TRINITY_DN3165_c0_g1_i4.p1  ORF type:complete len:1149 (+),score=187.02 TRINITY_DN3165_c0_g1_i4:45-3449(+)
MAAATAHEKQHRKCREAVRVCVRLRPLLPADGAAAWRAAGPAGVAECAEGAREAPAFTFQRVFDTGVSNEEVYKELVEPIVTRWLAGFNGTVLAYGQTASGKTYTMFGSVDEGVEGIIYLAIERMFAHFGQHSRNAERQYLLCVSFAEVYNEGVYDLLIDGGEQSPLPIRERNGTFYVEGLTESFATCAEDVLELLHTGNQHKALGSSCLHGHSSRSHTVFRFVLAQQALNNGLATVSELNLVDLAGAESMTYEYGAGQQKETRFVNASLCSLKDVVTALSRREKHIPYRNSTLTKLLQPCLGRNGVAAVVCCVSPAAVHREWTRRTLQFGNIAKTVVSAPKVVVFGPGGKMEEVYLKPDEEQDSVMVKVNVARDRDERARATRHALKNAYEQSKILDYTEIRIPTCAGEVFAVGCGTKDAPLALILPGYPGGWDDWEYIFAPLAHAGWHPVGVDMPGFGRSGGQRQSSRTERHDDPGGANSTVSDILTFFGVSTSRKCLLLGFDWGGGVALSLSLRAAECTRISAVVVFHPSWTAPLAPLNSLRTPTLLLWVPAEQNHPYSLGRKLARAVPPSTLVTLDCGHFSADKPAAMYCCISAQVIEKVMHWLPAASTCIAKSGARATKKANAVTTARAAPTADIKQQRPAKVTAVATPAPPPAASHAALSARSLAELITDRIALGATASGVLPSAELVSVKELPKSVPVVPCAPPPGATLLERQQWAVSRFATLLRCGAAHEYYSAYLGRTSAVARRPDAVTLFGSLPVIAPGTTLQQMHDWGVWDQIPSGAETLPSFSEWPRYLAGRQVIVEAPVRLDDSEDSLCLDERPGARVLTTHRAAILGYNRRDCTFDVSLDEPGGHFLSAVRRYSCAAVYRLNQPTHFRTVRAETEHAPSEGKYDPGALLVFEDGIRCKYADLVTRAKIMEAALALQPVVSDLHFEAPNAVATIEAQLRCVRLIARVMDCVHFVHEGHQLDLRRYARTDVGRLALHGRGHCHTVASVVAALLLPFSPLIGVEVRFRAGAWGSAGRPSDDHTWLELTLVPSLTSHVCDPSFEPLLLTLDEAYSPRGLRHPSAALQCGSLPPLPPACTWDDGAVQAETAGAPTARGSWPSGVPSALPARLDPINWAAWLASPQ